MILLIVIWAVLAAAHLGWVPMLRHQWALNLLEYQPAYVRAGLVAVSLLACHPKLAARVFRCAPRASTSWRQEAPLFIASFAALWVLRERIQLADSAILLLWASPDAEHTMRGLGDVFFFPEMGATFLMSQAVRVGSALSLEPLASIQVAVCLCGAAAAVMSLRLAELLVSPEGSVRELAGQGAVKVVAALLLWGGMLRIFAGHVEVYAFLLVAVLAYLNSAIASLQGLRTHAAAIAWLGVAVWMHASAVLLLPGLLFLLLTLPAPPRPSRLVLSACLVLVPSALFLAASSLLIDGPDAALALGKIGQVVGLDPHERSISLWVRGWGMAPSVGTDVVFLSRAHLKYLANSFYLLHPCTAPLLVLAWLTAPRSFLATKQARFVAISSVLPLIYALLLRPMWGPYDWDLFSMSSLCTAVLGVCVIVQSGWLSRNTALFAAVALLQLTQVGLPLVLVGVATPVDAGPFSHPVSFDEILLPQTQPPAKLSPWF